MKKLQPFYGWFFAFSLVLYSENLNAQNTWIHKLSYNLNSQGYNYNLLGVKAAVIGADGSLLVLANTVSNYTQRIFKFSPNSGQLDWVVDLGYAGFQVKTWCDVIKATSDSGIIACVNSELMIAPNTSSASIRKFAKDGSFQWGWQKTGQPFEEFTAKDVLERSTGNYYALIDDSLYILDVSGNALDSSGLISGLRFRETSNGDYIVLTSSDSLERIDSIGNLQWTASCHRYFDLYGNSIFLASSDSSVQKVNAVTGQSLWNVSLPYSPISEIEATPDGGCLASFGYKATGSSISNFDSTAGYLIRLDSLGDTLWTRTYQLPSFGLSTIKLMPNGNIFTGGAYYSLYSAGPVFRNPSTFCCMMNADGSYPLQQTSYVIPSDANHDSLINFVDDALEIMLAFGNTGPPRTASLDGNNTPHYCDRNDIAIDWNTFSAGGVNHKFSDFNGDGIIDTNDILSFDFCYTDSVEVNYRYGRPDAGLTTEEFCLQPVRDTIAPGDPVEYDMILGTDLNPVDSIYGLALSYFISPTAWGQVHSIQINGSSFGNPGTNLFSYSGNSFIPLSNGDRNRTLVCRTDFQNADNVSDTIGRISYTGTFPNGQINLAVSDFKAILVNGAEIPFSICTGSIFIDSSLVSVSAPTNHACSFFPNPSNEYLTIRSANGDLNKIIFMNSLGKTVREIISQGSSAEISVSGLPNGFYTGVAYTKGDPWRFSFVVNH